jgi:hypothetical protein
MAKAAPKSTRLDAAPLRKRAAVRGEYVVEVKAGDAVMGMTEGWVLERYVTSSPKGKKVEEKKKK